MNEITGWHVLITILTVILIASLCANYGFIRVVDNQQYRIEHLEYQLYKINIEETNACIDTVMLNSTCNIPHTLDSTICPQLNDCYNGFSMRSQEYEP